MRVLVCGGRDFQESDFIEYTLNEVRKEVGEISLIINGASAGADYYSSKWAKAHGVFYAEVPALWQYHGKSAGPKRNEKMIEVFNPDLIVAFPGGNGTTDMVVRGLKRDIEVIDLRDADVSKDDTSDTTQTTDDVFADRIKLWDIYKTAPLDTYPKWRSPPIFGPGVGSSTTPPGADTEGKSHDYTKYIQDQLNNINDKTEFISK